MYNVDALWLGISQKNTYPIVQSSCRVGQAVKDSKEISENFVALGAAVFRDLQEVVPDCQWWLAPHSHGLMISSISSRLDAEEAKFEAGKISGRYLCRGQILRPFCALV